MNPVAALKPSAGGLHRLKHLLLLILVVGLVSCSKEAPQPVRATNTNPGGMHEYYPVFAAVMIPDAFMQQQGVSYTQTNGWNFGSLENRAKVAGYILAHPGEFSFTAPAGNFVPVVWNHQQTSISIKPDPQQAKLDFDKYGMMVTRFDAGIDVGDEDANGYVHCMWHFLYGVHLKEPIGNSTDHGGSDVLGGGVSRVGTPDMGECFQCRGTSLWVVVELNQK